MYLRSRELIDVRGPSVELLPPKHDEAQHGARGHLNRERENGQAARQTRLGDVEEHQGKTRQKRGHENGQAECVEPDQEPRVLLDLVDVEHRVVSGCSAGGQGGR